MKTSCMVIAVLLAAGLPNAAAGQAPHGVVQEFGDDARSRFDRALRADRLDEAQQLATSMLRSEPGGTALLDELTYQLATAGGGGQAAALLLDTYPFADAAPAERERLLERLTYLLLDTPGGAALASDAVTGKLREPLDAPALRSRQAAFWAERQDCAAVRVILEDLAAEYTADDFLRLAHCSRADAPATALQAMERASTLAPSNAALQMDLGYAYWRDGRLRDAQVAFERAWNLDRNAAAAEQLVYVFQRLHQNDSAQRYAQHVLNAAPSRRAQDLDRRFRFRRLHEELGRRVTVSLDGWSGPRTGTGTGLGSPGRAYSSYAQLEVDYRLGAQPVRNGTTVSVFARLMADAGGIQSALPSENPTLGVGLRWKPFRQQVLFLSGEAQGALDGSDRRDVMLRMSASFLNGGSYNDDWHESGPGWFAHNLYLDAAHYVDAGRSAATADYRASYHGKVTGNQTMEPYGHLQVNGLRVNTIDSDLRVGAGVRWNLWYGAGRYDAPRHKLSLGVEMQQAIETYLADRRGVSFTLGSRW